MRLKILNTIFITFLLIGCGGGGGSTTSTADIITTSTPDTIPDTTPDIITDTPDTTAPEITVIGLNPLNIIQGSTYIDAGAIAIDDRDGSVTVTTEGNVNTDILGSYLLTYTATDSANNTSTATRTVNVLSRDSFVTLSGVITYDKIPSNSNYIGLDYNNITREYAKAVVVEAIDSGNTVVAFTRTDSLGHYSFAVPNNTEMKIRVSAKMLQAGAPSWDVKVVDNTKSNALYVMEGSLSSSGSTDSQRNLNASSGWSGSNYSSTRTAAPFAVLDNAYMSIQKVLSANINAVFPSLVMNWSINNVSLSGDTNLGQITTSHYTNGNLFILGDADSDTDEYDDHVVAHEWGHYYEDKFSRSDSIGGAHGEDDILDIRVALGEGWGNAFAGMALDDPIYFDTLGTDQANGFYFDVESGTSANKGWYSESSIQRILYDVYDSNHDGSDTLSLGFAPIHKVFTGAEKITPAFTSIFTFITALKDENAADAGEIESIVASENIAVITDIYGTGRINRASDYPYHDLTIGGSVAIETSDVYGSYNKLSNRKYVKFRIVSAGTYNIKVQQTNGTGSDPDFYLFDTSPFSRIGFSEGVNAGVEQKDVTLSAGVYLLDVSDYNNITNAQLNVSITLK